MESLFDSREEVIELLNKKYKNKNNISAEDITEEVNDSVINSEVEKFNDIFNCVFEEEILPVKKSRDCEDGSANEIFLKIIDAIKDSINKIDKEKLVKFLFKLISDLIFKKED